MEKEKLVQNQDESMQSLKSKANEEVLEISSTGYGLESHLKVTEDEDHYLEHKIGTHLVEDQNTNWKGDLRMKEMTIFVKEAINEQPIQTLETILMQIDGVERAIVDTSDGEVKITYNEIQVVQEKIKSRIQQHGLHLQE